MLTLTHVLCATDFSDVSNKAETYAAAIARHYGAALHLLHVDPPVPVMAPYGELPVDIRLFEEQREQAAGMLAAAVERARATGVRVTSALEGGHPAREILAAAAATGTDLLVIGTHGRGGVEHLLLGSVAEKVVRKAQCPVMVVPPGAHPETGVMFARILCPVDGSSTSSDAVAFALSLARETDGHVSLLHVVEPLHGLTEVGAFDTAAYLEDVTAQARKMVADMVPAAARETCRISEAVVDGKPSQRILQKARTDHSDIVVMGVRGRGAIDLLAFGSTTNEVIRRSECPVLAVHPNASTRRRSASLAATVVV